MERKTLFLYPKLDGNKYDELISTMNLVTDISRIIGAVNSNLSQVMRMGCFSNISCLPIVEIKEINRAIDDFTDSERVRICINKYDTFEYQSFYKNVIEQYKTGETDISHLVGLNIVSDPKSKPQFMCDTNKNFDVIIETGLDGLFEILMSIIMDISLYHYFNLSNVLIYRRKFSELKCNYIFKHENLGFFKEYGVNKIEELADVKYLPFSLKNVKDLNRRKKREKKKETLTTLIKNYLNMLVEILPTNVEVNSICSIMYPYDLKLKENQANCLEYYLKSRNYENFRNGKILFINRNIDSSLYDIDKEQLNMIELVTNDVESWLRQINYKLDDYVIYKIIQGDI